MTVQKRVSVACLIIGFFVPVDAARVRSEVATAQAQQAAAPLPLTMPNKADSLKFAILGDFGTGSREQYQLAAIMKRVHDQYPFNLVTLVGDNLYGSERPQDFKKKFEDPYKPLLDDGVKFYASLGNHDDPQEQRNYKLFNMDGKRYYSFKPDGNQSVRFFALESSYLQPEQVAWFEQELKASNSDWKIPYFHHPPYSSGERHGSDPQIRSALEPLFLKYNVSVVLTGHDHFYERTKPQKGIVYFVVGAGGQLRKGNIDTRTGLTAAGNDRDQSFMIAEINGDEMWFNAISRQGQVFDSGSFTRRK
ncbi:MAG TPA: metallophosphoesterase [Vicinamibacterales bacterium]|nr:metallophosphoesterase [Vicinamibacterales bacterium]